MTNAAMTNEEMAETRKEWDDLFDKMSKRTEAQRKASVMQHYHRVTYAKLACAKTKKEKQAAAEWLAAHIAAWGQSEWDAFLASKN